MDDDDNHEVYSSFSQYPNYSRQRTTLCPATYQLVTSGLEIHTASNMEWWCPLHSGHNISFSAASQQQEEPQHAQPQHRTEGPAELYSLAVARYTRLLWVVVVEQCQLQDSPAR